MAHLGNTIINGALRVIGGENVDTINGVTVGSSPKFTDTNNRKAFACTCSSAADAAAKVVSLVDSTGWELRAGVIVGVKFTNSNTASSCTLNVNGSGAKSIWYNGAVYTGNTNWICGVASQYIYYMYDGTYWAWLNFGWHSDGNNYVTQTATTTSANYEVLFSGTADNTTRTEGSRKNNNLLFNPSTGNLQATQLNGVNIGSSPKFTDTTYTFSAGTNSFSVVSSASPTVTQVVEVTPSITNNVTGSGTNNYLTKFNGTNTITNGPAIGSAVSSQTQSTKFLREDGTWSAPSYTTNTDKNVEQVDDSTDANRRIILSDGSDDTTRTANVKKSSNLTFNPSKQKLILVGGLTNGNSLTNSSTYGHAEGASTTVIGSYAHGEGMYTSAVGSSSHTEGYRTTASGYASHAEGGYTSSTGGGTTASGNNSHSEGYETKATASASHAEGQATTADADNAHAEGYKTSATGIAAHAEGGYTTASSGMGTFATNENAHAEGLNTTASGKASHAEGQATKASSGYSHAEGYNTGASGSASHAEGTGCIANAEAAHAEGKSTKATNTYAHAEGNSSTAAGANSHSEGNSTYAGFQNSHAEGYCTSAMANQTHAEGHSTCADNGQSYAMGHRNAAMVTGGSASNTNGTAFVIGNGTSATALKNAFSVQFSGVVKAASTITASTTADYAEYFEWADENPNNEDRVGYFVTFDSGDKIKIGSPEDEYILGIVSGEPFVLGNGDCDVWNGMVMRDAFRRTIYEPAPKYEYLPHGEAILAKDKNGKQIYEGTKPKYNPNYDPTQKYINRADRPEWSAVGMLGVLAVRDNGQCQINSYCTIGQGGIAVPADVNSIHKYRVIKRNATNVVEVVFR